MDTIGKYQLIRVIGEGGMGRVYEAIDPVIGRRVAIKTISLDVDDADTRARFFREAQSAGQLSHPNLITIHDIGEVGGMPYIVMEYLEGMDLNRTMRQERLSYDTKIEIMLAVCEGLSFAHGHDVIHRDIKPANIFRTAQGRIKILDFGLARGVVSEVTRTGKVLGTPNYMSPEQIRGDDVDHRADIFSAGVVFYELLTGRKPFEGDSIATTMYKVLETEPPPLHLVDAHLPLTLSTVVNRALAKDRSARFQTSGEMLDAISQGHGLSTYANPSRQHTIASSPVSDIPEPARARSSRSMVAGGDPRRARRRRSGRIRGLEPPRERAGSASGRDDCRAAPAAAPAREGGVSDSAASTSAGCRANGFIQSTGRQRHRWANAISGRACADPG